MQTECMDFCMDRMYQQFSLFQFNIWWKKGWTKSNYKHMNNFYLYHPPVVTIHIPNIRTFSFSNAVLQNCLNIDTFCLVCSIKEIRIFLIS